MFVKHCAVPGFISTLRIHLNDPNTDYKKVDPIFPNVTDNLFVIAGVRESGNVYEKLNYFGAKKKN